MGVSADGLWVRAAQTPARAIRRIVLTSLASVTAASTSGPTVRRIQAGRPDMATANVIALRPKKHRSQRGSGEWLTPEELLKILKVARERSTRDWCMIL